MAAKKTHTTKIINACGLKEIVTDNALLYNNNNNNKKKKKKKKKK